MKQRNDGDQRAVKKLNLQAGTKFYFQLGIFSWGNPPSHPLGELLLMLGTERPPKVPATEDQTLSPSPA